MKNLLNAVVQVDQSEHHSEERVVIRYNEGVETGSVTVNVAELTVDELVIYDAFKALCELKMNA